MTRVWVVSYHSYGDAEVVAVFSTEEAASRYTDGEFSDDYGVESFTVDEP